MKLLILLLSLILFVGCSTGPGSKVWHKERIQEIENMHKSGKITDAEYIKLKNEADLVVTTFLSGSGYKPTNVTVQQY